MSETQPPRPKRRWRRALGGAAGAAFVVGGVGVALGPGAAWIVDHSADGRRVWRLGEIQVEGVRGTWIGNLSAERVTLEDEQGVWAEAHDVALDWRPFAIFLGDVRIDSAHAASISILRRPTLTEKRIARGGGWDVVIGGLRVDRIDLAEGVLGEQALFTADLTLDLRDQALRTLDLALRRTDSDADYALATYRAGADFALRVDVVGEAGGVIAHALGVSDQAVRLDAEGDGDTQAGQGRFGGAIGDTELVAGAFGWDDAAWTLTARGQLDALPMLETLARRIGDSASLEASGARAGAFTAHAETPFLALDLSGALDDDLKLDGPAQFVARTARLSDIAREAPFELGAARFEGRLMRDEARTTIEGAFTAREMDILGRSAQLSGPVRAQLTNARFELDADLRAPAETPALFAGARLQTKLDYNRSGGRFTLTRARLDGDALALDAQGWANRGDGEFSGQWRVRRMETLVSGVTGAAAGRWRAFAEPVENNDRVWVTTMDGRGARIAGSPDIVPQLLGRTPDLNGMFRYERGGITVNHFRLEGAKLRLGALGRIVGGEADLAVEASARGPLDLGGAQIVGAADATGRLTGRLARPTLSATAHLASFLVAGAEIVAPELTFTLAPAGDAYRGEAQVRGMLLGQPLAATSSVVIADGALDLPELSGTVGALQAEGSARIASEGPTAHLALSGRLDGLAPGLTGGILGDVALTPETLTLDAQIADARAGLLRVRAATLSASGPYEAIEARFDLRGRLGDAPLVFAGTALISTEGGAQARIAGTGALADASLATRAPITLSWAEGGMQAALDVLLADGAVTASWNERGRALTGSAVIEDAPLGPLAAIWNERATGRIAGRVRLESGGGGLDGDADITLTDARIAGRQRGTLTGRIQANLDPSRLTATIDARSSEGLVARLEADAPVQTSAAPLRIALVPERRGRATWSITGPVEGLWSAARLQDQALEGHIEGEGALAFGAGHLSGDGHVTLRDGAFEDKITGVKLQNVQARIEIGDDGVSIQRFSANDSRGGQITATGGSANPREGHIAVTIQNLRLVDRPDARARASGQLNLAWEGLTSTLTGDLEIEEGEVNVAQRAEAGIPVLDVIEINRPDIEDEIDGPARPRANGSTRLDVRVRAPGRIFTRGRGLEAEWSLDLRLTGASAAPRFFGEARTIRGTLSLSGQPFEIESGRIVFDGAPENARIELTAERQSPDLTARILLSGTAADPDISFSSNPALPEDEILPQILFGRSVADLSALEAAQLAASLAALSGQASFDLLDAARAATGLDRFNVREDEAGGLMVAGGVYLTRDVYLEVARTGLGQAATRVEWTVRPQLVLITSFLPNGDQRASVRWRRETD